MTRWRLEIWYDARVEGLVFPIRPARRREKYLDSPALAGRPPLRSLAGSFVPKPTRRSKWIFSCSAATTSSPSRRRAAARRRPRIAAGCGRLPVCHNCAGASSSTVASAHSGRKTASKSCRSARRPLGTRYAFSCLTKLGHRSRARSRDHFRRRRPRRRATRRMSRYPAL